MALSDTTSIPKVLQLPTAAWLRALQDTGTDLQFSMFGHIRVDAKWDVPQRQLIEHLFYFVLDEQFEMRGAGRTVSVMPGTLLWMPPNFPHQLWIQKGHPTFTLYWFRLRAIATQKRRQELAPQMPAPGFIFMQDGWGVRPFMQTVVEELRARDHHHMERVRAALVLLTSSALRQPETGASGSAVLTAAQRVRLREFVSRRVRGRITPGELARELRLSHDYFSRIFRRSFGHAPKTWLMRERIQHAAQRLAASVLTVSEVAYEFGYRDVFLFSRQFKEVMSVGPKEWRKRTGL